MRFFSVIFVATLALTFSCHTDDESPNLDMDAFKDPSKLITMLSSMSNDMLTKSKERLDAARRALDEYEPEDDKKKDLRETVKKAEQLYNQSEKMGKNLTDLMNGKDPKDLLKDLGDFMAPEEVEDKEL